MRFSACYLIAASCFDAGCGHLPQPYAHRAPPRSVERRTLPPEGLSNPSDLPFRYTITPLVCENGAEARATSEAAYAKEAGVGWIPAKGTGKPHRVTWSGGRLVIDGQGSAGQAGNTLGDRVGEAETGRSRPGRHVPSPIMHAFLWAGTAATDLGSLNGSDGDSSATAINNHRQIVGTSGREAFIWEHGVMQSIGRVAGYGPPVPCAINERGTVLGTCNAEQDMGGAIWADAFQAPFIWSHGRLRLLPVPPGGTKTFALGLDDHDTAIGYDFHYGWQNAKREKTPLLWVKDKAYDLDRLIGRNSRWKIVMPLAISRDGRILASAQSDVASTEFRTSYPVGRAVLLTPSSQMRADRSAASLLEQTRRTIYSGGRWAPHGATATLTSPASVSSPPTRVRYRLCLLDGPSPYGEGCMNGRGQFVGLAKDKAGVFWYHWDGARWTRVAPQVDVNSCSLTAAGEVVESSPDGVYVWMPGGRNRILGASAYRAYRNADGDMVTSGPSLLIVGGKARPFDRAGHAEAKGINTSGAITGKRNGRAFLWQDERFSNLGALPGYYESTGLLISDRSRIVGYCSRPALVGDAKWLDAYAQPFIWERGVMRKLPTLSDCPRTFPIGMNKHGDIVGHGTGQTSHPVVWLRGYPYDIRDLVTGAGAWSIIFANGIDDSGRILVAVTRRVSGNQETRYALLTPLEASGKR